MQQHSLNYVAESNAKQWGLNMISAVVLVNTDLNSQDKVMESLKLVEGVEEAHALYGVYTF